METILTKTKPHQIDSSKISNKYIFELYKDEVSKYPPISKEKYTELFIHYRNGDNKQKKAAYDILINSNLRYVMTVAKDHQSYIKSGAICYEDLVSEGNLALNLALDTFDETIDVKFISYATYRIEHAIANFIKENNSTIRIPNNVQRNMYKVNKEVNKLNKEEEYDYNYTIKLDDMTHKASSMVANAHQIMASKSLSEKVSSNGDSETGNYSDVISNNDPSVIDNMCDAEAIMNVYNSLNKLDNIDREIIYSYYGLDNYEPLTYKDISKKYFNDDISSESVRIKIIKINKKIKQKISQ